MNPIPQANPTMMLPSSLLRGGQTTPGQIFQQYPLASGMSPAAMGADPTTMQQPPIGSQANNPTMPQSPQPNYAGMTQNNGQPGSGSPNMTEADYILHIMGDRLKHHSKVTEKTVNTLADMIGAGLPPAPVGGAT